MLNADAHASTYNDKFKLVELLRLFIKGRTKTKPEIEQIILHENELNEILIFLHLIKFKYY